MPRRPSSSEPKSTKCQRVRGVRASRGSISWLVWVATSIDCCVAAWSCWARAMPPPPAARDRGDDRQSSDQIATYMTFPSCVS